MDERISAEKYRLHWLMLIPLFLSNFWFQMLQKLITSPVYHIYIPMDDYIPFVEAFVIPYVFWYVFVIVTGVFLFRKAPQDFTKFAGFLTIGMVVACTVYTFLPNGQELRPLLTKQGGPLSGILQFVYGLDPPRNNKAPSLHVIYACACHAGITFYNNRRNRVLWVNVVSFILAALCTVSTVFVKQHSIVDMWAGLLVSGALYYLIYIRKWKVRGEAREKV